tara:strand:- start:27989 stop:28450 length:462 start_codon:yes stop_codon:yes gene_type:complete
MITWYLEPIQSHIDKIKELFAKNVDHKLASNYLEMPLFEHTKFARMGYDNDKMIYYSAGMERPQYNGSVRIMSRHTRDREYDFGSKSDDLARGLETLEQSVAYAQSLGYKDIWLSREFNPKLFEYFAKQSKYDWTVTHELMHYGEYQYIMRLQ